MAGSARELVGPVAARGGAPEVLAGGRGTRGHARRVARLLAPAAWRLGGFASAEARVHAGLGLLLRPDALVALGEPPADGRLDRPPLLVVALRAPAQVAAWLALGAEAVWVAEGRGARRWLADGTVTELGEGGRLDVPGRDGLQLAVAELLVPPGEAAAGRPDPLRGRRQARPDRA